MFKMPNRQTVVTSFVLAALATSCALGSEQTSPSEVKSDATKEPLTAAPSLRDKLAAQVDVDLHDKTLADLPAWLRDQHGVKAVLDIKAVEEAGIELSSLLSLRVQGISLRSALRHLLREHDLTWAVDGELLVITTPEEAEQNERVVVYPVRDLLDLTDPASSDRRFDYDSLLNLLLTTVAPDSWEGDVHALALLDEMIGIPQTDDVHEQVAMLLSALRAARQCASIAKNTDWSPVFCEPVGNQRIRQALVVSTDLVFADALLSEVANKVSDAHSIPVLLDDKALAERFAEHDVPVDTRVSFDGRGLPLVQVLRYLLAPIGLVPVVRDEALVITSREEAEQVDLGLRVYPVGDLVTPSDDPPSEADQVIGAITKCRRDTWAENKGPGSACYLSASKAVVVAHLDEVHEEIDKVLSDLRKARSEQGPRPKPDDNELLLKVYRLGQLPQKSDVPAEVAAALIQEFVAPETWTKDPDVRLRTAPDRLIVRQRRGVHKQIERFLEELGLGMGRGMGGGGLY